MQSSTQGKPYDCAVVGGGLGGLCLAIQVARAGFSVILFEKGGYPQHKVCGEYISLESWDFLTELGMPLSELSLPRLTQLGISAQDGFMLESPLPLGGFGISRYSLDHGLCQLARRAGATVLEQCKVSDVQPGDPDGTWVLSTSQGQYGARSVCGSFGKYAPAFAKWEDANTARLPNYIGVKYHIEADLAPHRIELHNFKDGYCGISKVDMDRYCLCYLSKASNLQAAGNDLKAMEAAVLHQNPHLKRYFTQSAFLYEKPLVISNVYFHPKATHHKGLLMLGDAAGAITPLCGNGMSMAMRASKLLADLLLPYLAGDLSRDGLVSRYGRMWDEHFKTRIWAGHQLQYLFGKRASTALALRTLHYFPAVTRRLIGLTHGDRF